VAEREWFDTDYYKVLGVSDAVAETPRTL